MSHILFHNNKLEIYKFIFIVIFISLKTTQNEKYTKIFINKKYKNQQ